MDVHTIYLVDGYGGSPPINWLEAVGQELTALAPVEKIYLAQPDVADVAAWDQALAQQIHHPETAFFIAHSLGTIALLRYLERYQVKRIAGAILVSGFARPQPAFPEFDGYFEGVVPANLSGRLGRTALISAKNDTVIPEEETIHLAKLIHYPQISLPAGNHFRASDGQTTFPLVADLVRFYLTQK